MVPELNGFLPTIYGMKTIICLHKLENPDWFPKARFSKGKNIGELKVKLRYKRLDADNRLKFLQDWFTKCVGLDGDELIFEDVVRKKQILESETEHVEVHLYTLDRAEFLPMAPDMMAG